jgi:Uma2 family endonuclease
MPTAVENAPETELPNHYEVVNGQVVEIAPMSAFASEIANRLRDHLSTYALRANSGRTRMDMLFRIPLAEDQNRNREPDLAFIKFDRWPQDRALPYRGNPIDVVPNVALEVVSPSDFAEDVLAKAYEYLRAGVELVWVIFPRQRQLFAFTAVNTAPRLFTETDTLDGATVLPGFSVPMTGLFPAVAEEPPAENDE